MVAGPNLFEPEFDVDQEGPVYRWRGVRLGQKAGAERLGAALYELPSGEAPWPLHYHLANEELMIVVEGRPSLRTPGGERELERGEVVARPTGERGACQLVNRSDEPVRLLIVSEMVDPDVVQRPESGNLSVFIGRAPGARGGGTHLVFRQGDAIGFWEGEEPPPPKQS